MEFVFNIDYHTSELLTYVIFKMLSSQPLGILKNLLNIVRYLKECPMSSVLKGSLLNNYNSHGLSQIIKQNVIPWAKNLNVTLWIFHGFFLPISIDIVWCLEFEAFPNASWDNGRAQEKSLKICHGPTKWHGKYFRCAMKQKTPSHSSIRA